MGLGRRNGYALVPEGKALSSVGRPTKSGIELLDLRQRHLPDDAAAVGCAINRRIVQHDQLPVFGHPKVHLYHVGSSSQTAFENRQCAFRPQPPTAPVGDDPKAAVCIKRMVGGRVRAHSQYPQCRC